MTLAEPDPQRHFECGPDRVGHSQEVNGALGVPSFSRQKSRRLEHDPAEPAVAELDEQCQRFFELGGGRVSVTEVGIDVRKRPECLAVCASVSDGPQDVEALVGMRRASASAPNGLVAARP